MKWNVTAVAMNRRTRERVLYMGKEKERTELVDTATWGFGVKRTALQVERAYEAFWNDVNPRSEDIVKVVAVERA